MSAPRKRLTLRQALLLILLTQLMSAVAWGVFGVYMHQRQVRQARQNAGMAVKYEAMRARVRAETNVKVLRRNALAACAQEDLTWQSLIAVTADIEQVVAWFTGNLLVMAGIALWALCAGKRDDVLPPRLPAPSEPVDA